MKRISLCLCYLLPVAALLWLSACVSGQKPSLFWPKREYLITVPPWAKISHGKAKMTIEDWTKPENLIPLDLKPIFGELGLTLTSAINISKSGTGGNVFTAYLNKAQAEMLSTKFSFTPKKRVTAPHSELIVSRMQRYPVPKYTSGPSVRPMGIGPTTSAKWAADAVFEATNGTKLTVSQHRTPVLYVVDTGIKPFVGSGSSWSVSSQFVNVKFQQGQIADGLGATWPDREAAAPWDKEPGELLNLTSPFALFPPTTGFLNPQEDADGGGHGTKIASTAVGDIVGVMGKLQKDLGGGSIAPIDVELHSIRIYAGDPGANPTYTPNPTTSQVVASGIYKAVAAHLSRSATLGSNAPSVLLFASRSTAGFDAAVETALWWAWHKGMICVVSGGNEPGSSLTTAMHVPNAMWYKEGGGFDSVQSTSPARFDWTIPAGDPAKAALWPNPTAGNPSEPVPMPNKRSLIIVGGNNHVFSSPNIGGNDHFRKSSTGAFQSSRGPDIDILAPSKSLPCATPGSNAISMGNSGTSFATGYVAGAALAYLACSPTSSAVSPDNFLGWLTPSTGEGKGCKVSTNPTGWSTGPYRHSCYTEEPMKVPYNDRVPTLYIKNAFP